MTFGGAPYPALWLCGRLYACRGHPPLSRSELAMSMSAYAEAPASVQRVVALRTAALGSLMRLADACFPTSACILDAGCGHGQVARWLTRAPERHVVGIDSSETRIRVAQGSETRPNLRFERAAVHDYISSETRSWDGFVFTDALLYLAAETQRGVLEEARKRAGAGALMLIKDSITEPAWKYQATRIEERVKLATGYYGNTQRASLTYRSRSTWIALLGETGWTLTRHYRTPRLLPYPGWVALCHAV